MRATPAKPVWTRASNGLASSMLGHQNGLCEFAVVGATGLSQCRQVVNAHTQIPGLPICLASARRAEQLATAQSLVAELCVYCQAQQSPRLPFDLRITQGFPVCECQQSLAR